MRRSDSVNVGEASTLIDQRIAELGGWRGEMLAKVRKIILKADPEIVEEWKWGTPVWSRGGIICTGEAYKKNVKTTFAKGAALDDPSGLFNSSLDGNVRRAIDFSEGEKVNEAALTALVRAAVAHNLKGKSKATAQVAAQRKAKPTPKAKVATATKKSPGRPDASNRTTAESNPKKAPKTQPKARTKGGAKTESRAKTALGSPTKTKRTATRKAALSPAS